MNASQLDVHAASKSERLDAYRNVHEFWGRGLSLEEHLQRRLESPQHNRAKWYVGCRDGQVVSSLGCYKMNCRVAGKVYSGIAIGSVHTRPEFRGHGFAPELLHQVEAIEADGGAKISILFSDINPGYYGRLGYVLCESHEGYLALSDLPVRHNSPRLSPFSLADQVDKVARMYESFHASFAYSIARDEVYWKFLCRKEPDDQFYWIDSDDRIGYLRIAHNDNVFALTDFALVDHSRESHAMLIDAMIGLGRIADVGSVGGWLPKTEPFDRFELKRRTREITMIKSLCPEIEIDDDVIRDAQHIREIDHV